MNELICKICNTSFNSCHSISTHINKKHNMTIIGYYLKYIDENNKCIICGNQTTFKNIKLGFRKYCSSKCANNDKEIQNKIKNTNLRKYGTETFTNREKCRKTCLEKYNCENVFQNNKIKEKIKKTNLIKYGVEHPLQNDDIKLKMSNTNYDRYGEKTFTSTEIGKQVVKKTTNEKYGVDNIFQLESIKIKIKNSNIKNLGVEYPMQSKQIMDKSKKTCLDKYGVEHTLCLKKFRDNGFSSHPLKEYKLNDGRIINYQSKPELLFIKKCEDNNTYIENGDIIEYKFNNRTHKYYIDFKIKENNKWKLIEIKSKHNWFFIDLQSGKLESKFNSAVKYSEENKYLDYILILDNIIYNKYDELKKELKNNFIK